MFSVNILLWLEYPFPGWLLTTNLDHIDIGSWLYLKMHRFALVLNPICHPVSKSCSLERFFLAVLHCESGATHINACLSTAVVFNLCITYAPVSLSREPDSLLLQKPVQDLQLQRKWAVNQEDVICNHEWSYPHFLKTKSCLLQIPSMCSSPH